MNPRPVSGIYYIQDIVVDSEYTNICVAMKCEV